MTNTNNAKLWVALAGLVAACPSLFCCGLGTGTLFGAGTYELENAIGQTGPIWGVFMICVGLLPWLLPLGVWRYVSRRPAVVNPANQQDSLSEQSYSPFSTDPHHDADASMQNMDSDW